MKSGKAFPRLDDIAQRFFAHVTSKNEGPSRSGGSIVLGGLNFSKNAVTAVGDLDWNGYRDYVVSNPKEAKLRGAVRVFMMGSSNKILRTRHIIPGKWGFQQSALRELDLFGSSVLAIGDVNKDGIPDVAIGAPGDSLGGIRKGAVYIVLLKNDGSVLQSHKLSSRTDASLRRQLVDNEGFGSSMKLLQDLNGDNVNEIAVGSNDKSTTLLFLNCDGSSRGGIKFPTRRDRESILNVSEVAPVKDGKDVTETQIPALDRISVRSADRCVNNATHCLCSNTEESRDCLSLLQSSASGPDICSKDTCPSLYKCSCDGNSICEKNRTTAAHKIYKEIGEEGDGRFYCRAEYVDEQEEIVIKDLSTLSHELGVVSHAAEPSFNTTHCSCTPKSTLPVNQTCFDLIDEIPGRALICASRSCKVSNEFVCDLGGDSVCERQAIEREVFVNDGPTEIREQVFCHRQRASVEKPSCIQRCP
jgi:hypothetical protein